MGSALDVLALQLPGKWKASSSCADIPQRAEIKGSRGNLTLVMTPLVLPSQAWPSLGSRRM